MANDNYSIYKTLGEIASKEQNVGSHIFRLNKNNTLFYDYANKKVLNFDIDFNELKIDKDNLELILKQITDMNINYEIDYYKNGPFDVIYHYAEENLFFNGKKKN